MIMSLLITVILIVAVCLIPTPSQEDIHVTRRLAESGKMIGIEVLDSIILGSSKTIFTSLKGVYRYIYSNAEKTLEEIMKQKYGVTNKVNE